MTTQYEQEQKQQQAQTAVQAVQQTSLNPNQGSMVPSVYQKNYVADEMGKQPKISAPSVENIHKNMWTGSMMVGLMAGLATGNPAAAIVAGMWGAVAIHDHGYALRQRKQYVGQLQKDGYSFPAILQWYKTGDNKDLEAERHQMQQDALQRDKMSQQDQQFNRRYEQQDRQFQQREADANSRFSQQMGMQQKRMGQMERQQDRMFNLQAMKYAADMGKTAAGEPVTGSGVHAQNASLIQAKPGQPLTMPPAIAAMPPELQAAAMQSYSRNMAVNQLAATAKQIASAKNLRTSESQQTAMADKIEEAYGKAQNVPKNKAGDSQLMMSYQMAESPGRSPLTTQIEPLEKEMATGFWDGVGNWVGRKTNTGLTDSDRKQAQDLLTNAVTTQLTSHGEHVKNVVQAGGYDLSNPEVMQALTDSLHVSKDELKGLLSGDMTPEQYAQERIDKLTPEQTTDFGDVPNSEAQQVMQGNW